MSKHCFFIVLLTVLFVVSTGSLRLANAQTGGTSIADTMFTQCIDLGDADSHESHLLKVALTDSGLSWQGMQVSVSGPWLVGREWTQDNTHYLEVQGGNSLWIQEKDEVCLEVGINGSAPARQTAGGGIVIIEVVEGFLPIGSQAASQAMGAAHGPQFFPNPCQDLVLIDLPTGYDNVQIKRLDGTVLLNAHHPAGPLPVGELESGTLCIEFSGHAVPPVRKFLMHQ